MHCVFDPLPLTHVEEEEEEEVEEEEEEEEDKEEENENRTSSWIFFRKAISSCSVSMRLSRSKRASVAASTSCHSYG